VAYLIDTTILDRLAKVIGKQVPEARLVFRIWDFVAPAGRAVEAEITARLEHPGIVPVYGLGCDPSGRPFYAMRFVRGESLKDAIIRIHRAEGLGQAYRFFRADRMCRFGISCLGFRIS